MTEYGLQLYSIRDISRDLPRALCKVAAMGYRGVEFAGFFGYSASEVKAALDAASLIAIGTHTSISELAKDRIYETIEYHKAIGCGHLTVPGANWSTLADMQRNIEMLREAAPILRAEGIELGYHNHSSEFFITPYGRTVEDEIIKSTDINLEIDTFWLYNAGIDPVSYIEKHRDRIKLIHLKDGISRCGVGADFKNSFNGARGRSLGKGDCPVKEIREAALGYGIGMIVESEDLAPTGLIEAERCIEYLRSLEF